MNDAGSAAVPSVRIEDGQLARRGIETLDVGDLDQNRNLKIRTFVRLGLRPLFQDLAPHLRLRDMAGDGVAIGQYYQDFAPLPRRHGYAAVVRTEHRISLCRAVEQRDEAVTERLVVETCATIEAQRALGTAERVGYEPPLGDLTLAGRSRVLHVLTRPGAPRGRRQVTRAPQQLQFLTERPLEGALPSIRELERVPEGFRELAEEGHDGWSGLWGLANSDVFQHVHAREYLFAMENRLGAMMAGARIPVASCAPTRARVIFRSPSQVGERYQLRSRLYRSDSTLLAMGSFHRETSHGPDERPAALLRFEACLL